MDEIDTLADGIDALENTMAGATGMAQSFDAELKHINASFSDSGDRMQKMERSLSSGIGRAIDGVVFDGMRLSDALKEVASSMVNAAYKSAVAPVQNHLAGLVTAGLTSVFGGAFATGAPFSQGKVMPFAKGGVVSSPTTFPMKGATGLMGEAGPEAIMPLTRGPDGALGVRAAAGGSGPVSVVMNISTPDATSFRRSNTQIAAALGRAVGRGQRNR